MICEQCADLPVCPEEVRGAYARACWLAMGEEKPEPDCERFKERDQYWRSRDEWRRGRVKKVRPRRVWPVRRQG